MKVLDLYCGGGGASMGIYEAGHSVMGVDINEQREYPFAYFWCDALDFLKNSNQVDNFDAFWASPPCQAYSYATTQWKNLGYTYPDLIDETRQLLLQTGKPFVIENVINAPLRRDLMLCGQMFNLNVRRHRIFEIHGFSVPQIPHTKHIGIVGDGRIVTVAGHGGGRRYNHCSADMNVWREAMGIDWITKRKTLTEAIPPAYSEYIMSFLEV